MLFGSTPGHGDEGGHGFDAVPQVLQAEVFVGGVLVVVVVGDGDADGAGVGGALHGVERDGPAEGGRRMTLPWALSTALMTSAAMGRSIGVREAVSPLVGLDPGDFGVGETLVAGGWGVGDEVALRADVVDDALLLGLRVDAYDEAEIKIGDGGGWDGVGGVGAGLAGGDAVDVEGGQVEEFEEMFAGAFGVAEGEFVAEEIVVDGGFGEGFFRAGRGDDAVVEVRD